MGYSYDLQGHLCCDACPVSSGVRKRPCPFRHCPSAALCKACYARTKATGEHTKARHESCRIAAEKYASIERITQAVLASGKGAVYSLVMANQALRSVTLWKSYVGKGAPSNAAGQRVGHGVTKAQASEAACHWNNQAPYEKFKRVTISDELKASSFTGKDEIAAWEIVGIPGEFVPKTALDKEIEKLIHNGKYATAITLWLDVTIFRHKVPLDTK